MKHLFLFIAILTIMGCKQKQPDTETRNNQQVLVINNNNESPPDSASFYLRPVIDKMKSQQKLQGKEINIIFRFLLSDNPIEESLSEELGYTMYTYLAKNHRNNNDFMTALTKTSKTYQDSVFFSLVKNMCIDIGEGNYNYIQFISDFPVFKDNKAAEDAFNDCMRNQIE